MKITELFLDKNEIEQTAVVYENLKLLNFWGFIASYAVKDFAALVRFILPNE